MPPIDKPSSINNIKDHKLTKRRLLSALSSAGFGTATVSSLTIDDVKAADSDQVTIALTCDGDRKERVSSDWYDHLVRARRVTQRMEKNWLGSGNSNRDTHNDVFGVWLNSGSGSNAPHVIITIDRNSSTKDETRGEVPERRNDVRIEVEERSREYESACDPKCKENLSEMPGGLEVCFDGVGCGTLGPQAWDYNDNTWNLTTAAHVPADDGHCGDDIIGDIAETACGDYIGRVKYIDHTHDICIIDPYMDPLPEVWNPEDHSERWGVITDSLSADGVDYWMGGEDHDERKVWKYGAKTCHSEGYVDARGKKEDPEVGNPCTPDPNTWNDCVRWGSVTDLGAGDSGSIAFGADPYSNDFYAVCQNSWRWVDPLHNYTAGPAGYAWKNKHGYEWRTF